MPPPTSSLKPTAAKSATDAGSGAKATGDKKSSGQLAKPDQSKYNAEQDEINKEIAAVKEKIVSAYMANIFSQYCAEAHGTLTASALIIPRYFDLLRYHYFVHCRRLSVPVLPFLKRRHPTTVDLLSRRSLTASALNRPSSRVTGTSSLRK